MYNSINYYYLVKMLSQIDSTSFQLKKPKNSYFLHNNKYYYKNIFVFLYFYITFVKDNLDLK